MAALRDVLCLVVAASWMSASGTFLQRSGACPSSTFEYVVEQNAAGDDVWLESPPVPLDQCVDACVDARAGHVMKVKFCGPGTFVVSRMSCNNHDYKSVTFEHPPDQYTSTDCEIINAADHYQIDGSVGSVKFSCSTAAR